MKKLLMLAVVAGTLCLVGSASTAEAGTVVVNYGGHHHGYQGGYGGYGYGGYRGGYGWGGYRGGWGYNGYGWNGGWNNNYYRPPIHRW